MVMGVDGVDDAAESNNLLGVFLSPSTLPHLLSLGVLSGFLFFAMKVDLFGSETQGGVVFLSLSVSYFFAAMISPSRIGGWIFKVQHDENGVLSGGYLFGGFSRMLPIFAVAGTIWLISNFALGDEQLGKARILLALLFIAMSVFQGFSLAYGWVLYGRKVQRAPRKSRVGRTFTFFRSIVAVAVFSPLVWWFGFGAENPRNAEFTEKIYWIIFLLMIGLLGVLLDRYTKSVR